MGELALFMTIKTQSGQRDSLVALWDKHLKARANDSEDQQRYVLALDMKDPDIIRISEVYGTMAAFEANAQAPWFVCGKRPVRNELIVTQNEQDLLSGWLSASEINWLGPIHQGEQWLAGRS